MWMLTDSWAALGGGSGWSWLGPDAAVATKTTPEMILRDLRQRLTRSGIGPSQAILGLMPWGRPQASDSWTPAEQHHDG